MKQLKQLQINPDKSFRASTGFEPADLCDTGPALLPLSYEALWQQGQVWVEFIPVTGWGWDNLYTLSACIWTSDIEH